MKTLKIAAIAAVAVLGALGCGNSQARVYRIAVDASALDNLPPSCYDNNTVPTTKTELTNEKGEIEFTIWDGPDGKQYLESSVNSWPIGDADPVQIAGPIESTDSKVFSGTVTKRVLPNPASGNPNFSSTSVSTFTVTFEDNGNAPKGNIALNSQYTCTSCTNNNNKVNCSAQMPFTGRRIDYSNLAAVSGANP